MALTPEEAFGHSTVAQWRSQIAEAKKLLQNARDQLSIMQRMGLSTGEISAKVIETERRLAQMEAGLSA